MDAICDPAAPVVVVMASSQVGKSEVLNNAIGYYAHRDPAPMLMVQPTVELARAYSKDRINPMIRDTPALAARIGDPTERDGGNAVLHKEFPGGNLSLVGANSPSGLAGRPKRVVLEDEVDRHPKSAGKEGNPGALAWRRAATFWNRKRVRVSTPTVKGESEIEAAYAGSDKRRYYVPCPHCDHMQTLAWARVHWDKDGDGETKTHLPETALYYCEDCGAGWSDVDRRNAVKQGEWRGEKPFRGVAGFHISELYSPWSTLREIVRAFLDARKDPALLQVWTNTCLGEPWEDVGERPESDALAGRREVYEVEAPEGVGVITVGVDVQDDRIEAETVGWGRDEESWQIDYRVLPGDPSTRELWDQLDAHLLRKWRGADGREIRARAVCIDSGGHYTQQVYGFCRSRGGRRVWAVKGVGGTGERRPVWPRSASRNNAAKANLYLVGVDAAKDAIYGRLAIARAGPGYCHFPADTEPAYFEGLTAERVVTRYRHGRAYRVYECPKHARNEPLDCRVYAYAALCGLASLGLRLNREAAKAGRTASGVSGAPEETATAPPQSRSRRRTGFLDGGGSIW